MQRESFVLLIAFASGMCSLVYEVVWMRAFTPIFGLSVYATTMVLCAFMGGLGLGSALAPRLLAAWRRSPWALYALVEVGIGLCAASVPLLRAPITSLYVAAADLDASGVFTSAVRFGLSAAALLPATILMGVTLPVLAQACAALAPEHPRQSRRIGLLYGWNTAGGAVGCLLVGFVLLYRFGVGATTWITAGLNLALAAIVLLVFVRGGARAPRRVVPTREAPAPDAAWPSRRLLLGVYALIGAAAFGYELSWFRILVFYLQSATDSLSIMLALFLLGSGAGSLCFSRFVEPRLEAKGALGDVALLGLFQLGIGVCGAATFHLYAALAPLWASLVAVLGAGSWGIILVQKGLVAGVVILPPTFLMGMTFPLLGRLYKQRGAGDARSTAHLYAANTFGAIGGTLLTGFVLFDWIGVQKTLLGFSTLSAGVGVGIALPLLRASARPRRAFAALALLWLALLATTAPRSLIAHFEARMGEILFYRESAADITFVYQRDDYTGLAFNDGRGTASTWGVTNYVNRLLAYSTMVSNPAALDVLVISMGAGNTASAYARFPIRRLDIVDISPGPFEAAAFFPTNKGVLDDPRVHIHVEDGRNFLLRTDRRFDIIQLEPPTLHTDGVVNLYTREFYEIARSRLREGGVLSQWIDASQTGRDASYMLIHTMLEIFPEATAWAAHWAWWVNGTLDGPALPLDFEGARALFARDAVRADAREVGSSLADVVAKLVASGDVLHEAVAGTPVITDDRTLVDFLIPKLDRAEAFGGGVAYYTSPVRGIFQARWARDDAPQARTAEMFPFHPPARHRRLAERSIREATASFPEPVRRRVLERAQSW